MNNLKVGIFTEVYHPTINGVVVSIDTFKTELTKLGVESTVFAPTGRSAKPEPNVIRLPSLPIHPDYALPLPWFSQDFQSIGALGLELIHTQHPFTMGWLGMRTARRLGIPVVTTYHTLLAEYVRSHARFLPFGHDLMVALSREYCNRVDLVIVPTPSMKKVLEGYGVTSRIEVNPTGIQAEEFQSEPLNIYHEFAIPDSRKVLLFVGRMAEEKNVSMLLQAFVMLQHEHPDVHLLLIGGGPQLFEYQKFTRQTGIAAHVTFAGFVPKEKTTKIFADADLFVFPSLTDTQGIVILEAMAAGTPIVAVDALGPGDLIKHGETGLLTTNNPADFSQAIASVLQDRPMASELAKNARQEVKKYSVAATAKKQLELYQSVLSAR